MSFLLISAIVCSHHLSFLGLSISNKTSQEKDDSIVISLLDSDDDSTFSKGMYFPNLCHIYLNGLVT